MYECTCVTWPNPTSVTVGGSMTCLVRRGMCDVSWVTCHEWRDEYDMSCVSKWVWCVVCDVSWVWYVVSDEMSVICGEWYVVSDEMSVCHVPCVTRWVCVMCRVWRDECVHEARLDSLIYVTWLIQMWYIYIYIYIYIYTQSGVSFSWWHRHSRMEDCLAVNNANCALDFLQVPWLIHMCDMTHAHLWHDSFTCVTWLIYVCDMTHLHVWHVLCTFVTWMIHTGDLTHSYVWHDSFICVTWLVHMCGMND